MPGENLPRQVWNRQTKITCNHWLAALVKGKCSSTKPTRLATGVKCHPDTEQNRPSKNPLALPGFEPGTYCTASENFTSVPHYSNNNPFRFLQRFVWESVDSPPFNLCISHLLLRQSTWILATLLTRIFARMDFSSKFSPWFCHLLFTNLTRSLHVSWQEVETPLSLKSTSLWMKVMLSSKRSTLCDIFLIEQNYWTFANLENGRNAIARLYLHARLFQLFLLIN